MVLTGCYGKKGRRDQQAFPCVYSVPIKIVALVAAKLDTLTAVRLKYTEELIVLKVSSPSAVVIRVESV